MDIKYIINKKNRLIKKNKIKRTWEISQQQKAIGPIEVAGKKNTHKHIYLLTETHTHTHIRH